MKTLKREKQHNRSIGFIRDINPKLENDAQKLFVTHKAALSTHSNRNLLEELYSDLIQIDADLDVVLKSHQSNT